MTIAVDLDGVIHQYSKGWYDGTIYDPPIPGAIDGLRQLMSHEAVFIFTTRDTHQTVAWLHAQGLPAIAESPISARVFWDNRETLLVTNRKLAARAYLDDRAIRFTSWNQALHDLLTPGADEITEPPDAARNDRRAQYAAAARTARLSLGPNAIAQAQLGKPITLNMNEADDLADAVLSVRDSELELLRGERDMLGRETDRLREQLESVHRLRQTWLSAGPPSPGTSIARWWDARLIELDRALGQPTRTD